MASTYLQPPSPRRRFTAVALTILVHLLLALLLLNLAPDAVRRPFTRALSTFTVGEEAATAEQTQAQPEQRQQQQRRQSPRTPPPPRPTPPTETPLPDYLRLTRDQFAALDLARMPSTAPGPADAADTGADSGAETGDSASTYGPGAGPGGARLYRAEWVREPTSAELRTYLPRADQGSWGEIACRTIPDNRVENCQLLGESPLGSKIATGMRRAAWQFRVRPPRRGGKALIGEWVRIRIDFDERGAEARR